MHKALMIAVLGLVVAPAQAQIAQRDRLDTRFENDIRANNDAMRRKFSGPSYHVETQNARMRERLNATKGSGLRNR